MATLSLAPFTNSMTSSHSGNCDTYPERREILILRKKPKPLVTEQVVENKDIQVNSAATTVLVASAANTGRARKKSGHQPPPVAVARRNARERNRVKQVNNGFATLRQHIPLSVAAAYSSSGDSGRSSKKLSKVETLRMAVDYIRSLQELLSSDDGDSPSSPAVASTSQIAESPILIEDEEDTSLLEAPSPAHYRNTASFIQLVNAPPVDDGFVFPIAAYPQSSQFPTSSLSPGEYSEQSLSPDTSQVEDIAILPTFTSASTSVIQQQDVIAWWEQDQRLRIVSSDIATSTAS
ncbi:hypothetical protein C0J52_14543 [Blattella germanica]|nr:hypothetical protein C0J52_14543 [Blattella germanica]